MPCRIAGCVNEDFYESCPTICKRHKKELSTRNQNARRAVKKDTEVKYVQAVADLEQAQELIVRLRKRIRKLKQQKKRTD